MGLLLLAAPASVAQPTSLPTVATRSAEGAVLLNVEELAGLLGWSWTAGALEITVRHPNGVLTLFDGAADALWQAAGTRDAETVPLAAPVQRRDARWFAPGDAFGYLGLALDGDVVVGANGPLARLEGSVVEREAGDALRVAVAPGVDGLRFVVEEADGAMGSLLLVDAAMLPIAFPDLRAALDAALAERVANGERILAFVVVADATMAWEPRFVARQDGLEIEALRPFRVQLLAGDDATVGPGSPALGILRLPATVRLDRPLEIVWLGLRGTLTFRP